MAVLPSSKPMDVLGRLLQIMIWRPAVVYASFATGAAGLSAAVHKTKDLLTYSSLKARETVTKQLFHDSGETPDSLSTKSRKQLGKSINIK